MGIPHIGLVKRPASARSFDVPKNRFSGRFALVIVNADTTAGAPERTTHGPPNPA